MRIPSLIINNHIQSLKFILVGVLNTAIGYGCYFICLHLGLDYILSLTISHIIGVANSFLWNKLWTFKSKGGIRRELPRFITVYAVTYILNLAVLAVLVEGLSLDKRLSQAAVTCVLTAVSYFGHRLWSFKG
jgi:putative flippase GtrA